jgi:hypothetical protein
VVQPVPYAYQEDEGGKHQVACAYVLHDENSVGFEMGAYDPSQALVIDPVLAYSRLMGGSALELPHSMVLDSAGNLYVAGPTYSTDFFFLSQNQKFGSGGTGQDSDTFIAAFTPDGALIQTVRIGGADYDEVSALALDETGSKKLFLAAEPVRTIFL